MGVALIDTSCSLSFGLLGELRVNRDGHDIDPGPRLQRHLLAILLIEAGRVVAVDRLVDLLWGDEPPAAALASLQAYVSQLRRILEPDRPPRTPARILVTQDPGYALRVEPDQVDAWRFLALAGDARELLTSGKVDKAAHQLDVALGTWRGEALAEFANERWAVPVAARLGEARDVALEDRIDAWLALGRHSQAVSELEEMVQARPLRERRWGQLIVANYRSGRQADALRAYQRCRSVLSEDLGIEPGPELRRLESAVLAQDPALEWKAADLSSTGSTSQAPGLVELIDSSGEAPPVAARNVQLDRLRERTDQARGNRGGVVVIIGEPGVGKTTLAERAAEAASAAGAIVAWSRCTDAAAAPAYWPWIQLLGDLPEAGSVASARRRLAGEAGHVDEGSAATFQAYDALISAFREAAATAPVVAVIDDLHAADEASLALLQLAAGDLHRLGVLIITTLRDTEPSPALERTLGDLLRHRGVERLTLPLLGTDDVERVATQSLGHTPNPTVTAELLERTGGNPFYLTELLRLLASEHRNRPLGPGDVTSLDVPSGVRDILQRRVERLPDNTRALLTVAAVAGRDTDLDLLERAANLDSEELMLALEPAIAAGLLRAGNGGWRFQFRHPLIQEGIYAATGRLERARLHARVAAALETLPNPLTPDRLAELAHHHLAAGPIGDPTKAVFYARNAAEAAMRQGAWADAVRRLEQALAVIGAAYPDAERTRCDVLIELAQAQRAAGQIREFHQTLQTAIHIADTLGDDDRLLAAAVAFGTVALWGSREWGQTDHTLIKILEGQLTRVADQRDGRTVRILATLACELSFDDLAPRGWDYANQAMELARELDEPRTLGIAISGYLLSAIINDHLHQLKETIEGLLADATLELEADVEAVLRTNLLTERLRAGDLATFDAELNRVKDLATEVLHSTELQGALGFIEACRCMIVADVAGARDAGDRGFALISDTSGPWAEPSRFVRDSSLMLISGTLAEHADKLAEMIMNPAHPSIPHLAAPAAALAYVQRGDHPRALELARRWFTPPSRSWTWIQPIAYWAQVAAAIGEPDPAFLYEQLLPHAGELALVGIGADCGGAVDSLLAGLALRLGRPQDALAHAHAGLTLERRANARAWLPRTSALIEAATS